MLLNCDDIGDAVPDEPRSFALRRDDLGSSRCTETIRALERSVSANLQAKAARFELCQRPQDTPPPTQVSDESAFRNVT
jgi:hypothetical protein